MVQASRVDAAVIGAGPYGLSVAAHLKAHNLNVRIFGSVLSSWRENMPEGMFLKSTPGASNLSSPEPGLTLADYCRSAGTKPLDDDEPVPIELFVNYGLWFQHRAAPEVEDIRVERLKSSAGGFGLVLQTGEELVAGQVIIATGLSLFAYVPPVLAAVVSGKPSRTDVVSHSAQHRDLTALTGKRVLVVGAGQSALENATLLSEMGIKTTVVCRGEVRFQHRPVIVNGVEKSTVANPQSPLGPGWSLYLVSRWPHWFHWLPETTRLMLVRKILGPCGAWWLRDRLEANTAVRAGSRIVGAVRDGNGVTLDLVDRQGAKSSICGDHVIAATGYRVNMDQLQYLAPEVLARIGHINGWPKLRPNFESTVPGLYFVGLPAAATFGPLLRFVAGTKFAASRVAASVAGRRR